MQAEEAVEIDRDFGVSGLRFGNRDRRARVVITRFTERHDDVQAVDRAALKDRDQSLAFAAGDSVALVGQDRTLEKTRRGERHADACQRDAARFKKKSAIHKCYLYLNHSRPGSAGVSPAFV